MTFVSITDQFGGAEQLIFRLVTAYLNRYKSVTVYFLNSKSNAVWEELQQNNPSLEIHYADGSFIQLIKLLSEQQHEVIFSTHLMINALIGVSRKLNLIKTQKLVCRESTSVFVRYKGLKLWSYKAAYYFGYHKIDLLLCQTTQMKEILLSKASFLRKRTQIIVLPNPFEFPDTVSLVAQKDPFVISAGRLIREKGFDVLIYAFEKFKKDFPNHKLIILGEGNLRTSLQELINNKNLQNYVLLKGFEKDVYPYFKQADLGVVSSIREGFPNVLLQMMSQNEKVVSTLCAGDIDQIKGIHLAETNNVESLYQAMILAMKSENNQNRELFDNELNSRNIQSFIQKINDEINY